MRHGDLHAQSLRNTGMLTTPVPNATPVKASLAGLHAVQSSHGRGAKAKEVNADENAKRLAWVAQLRAVCDAKDAAAFAEIFAYFGPRVKSFLMKSGASADLAEECTQDVMVTIWNKAHLFDPAKASAATWIFTIARNRRIDLMRKQRRVEPEDLPWAPDAEPDQEDVMVLQQESEILGTAIAALPEKQRMLIEKAYYGDLSHSEIAAETGLPLGTIKSRIRLALTKLRQTVG